MKTKALIFLLPLTFLFLLTSSCSYKFQDATDAFNKKDYKTAYRIFLKLAEQGNAEAQYYLGLIHDQGLGVPQDFEEAVKQYRLAADQGWDGNEEAQYNLGVMYAEGNEVLQDYSLAHMWFNIAFSNGASKALEKRKNLESQMTPQQIEKAQEMAGNWKPKD